MDTDSVWIRTWLRQPDGTYAWDGDLAGWADFSFEPRDSDAGPWSLTLPVNEQTLRLTKRHRYTFDFRGKRFTGIPTRLGPSHDGTAERIEAGGLDALALLGHIAAYPDPDAGPAAQLRTHYRDEGAAEDVLRRLVKANVERRGEVLDLLPTSSLGRGKGVTTLNLYNKPLLEVLRRKARRAGLSFRMGLVTASPTATVARMALEFYDPADRSAAIRLTPRTGIREWRQEDTAPEATRALVAAAYAQTPHDIGGVSVDNDTLTITGGADATHKLKTGSEIQFRGRAPLPSPLDDGTSYYAIRVDANTFKVARRRTKALDGVAVNITDGGGLEVDSVNVDTDAINIVSGDLPKTGRAVRVFGGGTPPTPLNKTDVYYAIRVDRNTLKLATSEAAAGAGNAINLTAAGSGDRRLLELGGMKVVEISREEREVVDADAEAEWDYRIETFVDARSEDPDAESIYTERGEEDLAEKVAQSSMNLTVIEPEGIRYGDPLDVGDTVTVQLLPVLAKAVRLGAVRVSGGDQGVQVAFVPGNPNGTTPIFKQQQVVRALRRELHELQQQQS